MPLCCIICCHVHSNALQVQGPLQVFLVLPQYCCLIKHQPHIYNLQDIDTLLTYVLSIYTLQVVLIVPQHSRHAKHQPCVQNLQIGRNLSTHVLLFHTLQVLLVLP